MRQIPRNLIKHLEWEPGRQTPTPPQPPIPPANAGIQSLSDAWEISGVQYRNDIYTVDLGKALLDNGNGKTQDEWVTYSEAALDRDDFRTPDYPLLYGIVKSLYTQRNDSTKSAEIAEAQKFLKDTSRAKWLMTLTRIKYQHSNDIIVHNHGTRSPYEKSLHFVGPDEYITDTKDIKPYQALLDTADGVDEIKGAFEWLNGTNTYLWRVNSKDNTERVARFYANSGRAYLCCYRDPSNSNASLGVRIRKKI